MTVLGMMDIEDQAIDFNAIPIFWQSIQAFRDEATQGCGMCVIRKFAQGIAKVAHAGITIDDPATWPQRSGWCRDCRYGFSNVSDEFLDNILECNDA